MPWRVFANRGEDSGTELDSSPRPQDAAEVARDLTLRKGPVVLESPEGDEFQWSEERDRFEALDPDVPVPPEIQLSGTRESDADPTPPAA